MNIFAKYTALGLAACTTFVTSAHYATKGWNYIESTAIQYVSSGWQKFGASILPYTGLIEANPTHTMDLKTLITQESLAAGINPKLTEALIHVESSWKKDAINFNPHLEPKYGKMGGADHSYMQINGQWINSKLCPVKSWEELYQPELNIKCGVNILADAIKSAENNIPKALVIYNCGKINCEKGINYSQKIGLALLQEMRN